MYWPHVRRRNNIDIARSILVDGIQRTDLDWPEAVFEAFLRFETIHGDLTSLADATRKIGVEEAKLAKRRQKASQEQLAQYYAEAVPVEQATTAVVQDDRVMAEPSQPATATNNADLNSEGGIKRYAR